MDRSAPASRSPGAGSVRIAAIAVALAACLAYAPSIGNGFVNLDDDYYVIENYSVQRITADGLRWAFTKVYQENWHPLTWISHMIDGTLFGMNPHGHHAMSVLLHAASAAGLVLVLYGMTGLLTPSALVAGLFALHPLNVESVAWVSERKGVLSTFLWVLVLWGYLRYVRRPSSGRYAWVLVLYALGLMAKPMLVTLPFVLVLLDAWPLRRLGNRAEAARAVREKLPMLVLAIVSSIVTLVAQTSARVPLSALPVPGRIANAVVSYVSYLGKAFLPVRLAPHYPLPGTVEAPPIPFLVVAASAAFIAVVTYLAVRARRRSPHLLVGWLWYLGTLVPVIGLVQVGAQSMADRYAHIPLIGVFIAVAWSLPGAAAWPPKAKLAAPLAAVLLVLGITTARQTRIWHDSDTLWTATLRVSPTSRLALVNYGLHLMETGRAEEGMAQFGRALAIDPGHEPTKIAVGATLLELGRLDEALAALGDVVAQGTERPEAHAMVGLILGKKGDRDGARRAMEAALSHDPAYVDAHIELGVLDAEEGRFDEAVRRFRKALAFSPADPEVGALLGLALVGAGSGDEGMKIHQGAVAQLPEDDEVRTNVGVRLARMGGKEQAIALYRGILDAHPLEAKAQYNLANALSDLGQLDEAIAHYRESARLDTAGVEARYNLAVALIRKGQLDEAFAATNEALALRPDYPEARYNLGMIRMKRGDVAGALGEFREALRLRPDYAEALVNQGVLLAQSGRSEEAAVSYQEAIRVRPSSVQAYNNLALLLAGFGRRREALEVLRTGLGAAPGQVRLASAMTWILATSPEPDVRSGDEAVAIGEQAAAATGRRDPHVLDTLAAGYAEAGRFKEARTTAKEAITAARANGDESLSREIATRLALYEKGQPYRVRG